MLLLLWLSGNVVETIKVDAPGKRNRLVSGITGSIVGQPLNAYRRWLAAAKTKFETIRD